MNELNAIILKAISQHQIEILDRQFSFNYRNFEKYKNDLDHYYETQSYQVLTLAEVDSFLDPKLNCVKKVSKEFFKQYTDLDQFIPLRITTLFSMYLILEINQHMQTLTDDKRSVWNKLEEFFAWNTHETESLKTKLQDSNTKFFGYGLLAITLVAKISLSMNASSFAFERSSNNFVFSLLFLVLVALSLYLIFSSKKMSQLSAHAQHYTLDHIIHKFNEISKRSIEPSLINNFD